MTDQQHQGKILKLKTGYNPNSSSVGSQIPDLIYMSLSIGAVSVFLSSFAEVIRNRLRKSGNDKKDCENNSD
jgi:hypothetical protein